MSTKGSTLASRPLGSSSPEVKLRDSSLKARVHYISYKNSDAGTYIHSCLRCLGRIERGRGGGSRGSSLLVNFPVNDNPSKLGGKWQNA